MLFKQHITDCKNYVPFYLIKYLKMLLQYPVSYPKNIHYKSRKIIGNIVIKTIKIITLKVISE